MSEGTYITPSLRLVRQLGQGGMGSVWIADHLGLHTQVVVKFMSERFAQDRKWVERFTREAAAAAQIRSPHVAQVFDHGVTQTGIPFIVMELLEGYDLSHHIRSRGGIIPPTEMANIITQVAKALVKAHERGIVHRDIKPDNIFLCDAGSGEFFVKLLDFGIAKSGEQLTEATNTGAVMGTPYYMSPEQMLGAKNVDHRTDLWSLAVVAYLGITGSRPFTGETYGALAVAIANAPLPQPTLINPSLPKAVDDWFAKACARDPAQRYSTARELAEAFNAAVNGSSSMSTGAFTAQMPVYQPSPTVNYQVTGTGEPVTSSTNPDGLAPTERAKKKGPPIALFAAIAVVLLGAVGFGGYMMFGRTSPPKDDAAEPVTASKKQKPETEPAAKPSAETKPETKPSAAATEEPEELPPQVASAEPSTTAKPAAVKPALTATAKPTTTTTTKPPGKKYNDDIR